MILSLVNALTLATQRACAVTIQSSFPVCKILVLQTKHAASDGFL
jgi:hypothetical protein